MNSDHIDNILRLTSNYSVWLPFLAGAYTLGKGSLHHKITPIFILIVLSFISDVISIFLAETYGNNMPWFHGYQILEGGLLAYYFTNLFERRRIWKVTSILFLTFLLINSLFLGSFFEFNTRGTSVSAIFFIALCLFFYYKTYSDEENLFIERNEHFWIVTGILIYYSGSFFTFLSYETFKTWMFHNMANTIKNIFLFIGFFFCIKR